jgi:hypothetical protein
MQQFLRLRAEFGEFLVLDGFELGRRDVVSFHGAVEALLGFGRVIICSLRSFR